MSVQTKTQPLGGNQPAIGRPPMPSVRPLVLGAALIVAVLLGSVILGSQGVKQGILFGIGLLLGYTLYHARFGFTSAFRRLVSVGQGAGVRAHMLMLSVASLLFAPILSSGVGFFGAQPEASVAPVGASVLVGAFIFGIGMQMGGGCASGVLYQVGGGGSSVLITLIAFIAGSVIGAWHWDFWVNQLPSLPPISLAETTGLGYGPALLIQLALFGAIAGATVLIARRKKAPPMKPLPTTYGLLRVIRGSWPLWVGALLLAGLNALTLAIKGSPWGITSAFALWGSKVLSTLGVNVSQWAYWSGDRAADLKASVLADTTSVMNFGIILGAMVAAAAAGTYAFRKVPGKVAMSSIIGGLLMGYGARLAYGCNIGAYFGGIASFSLHGWVWAVMALTGTFIGLRMRSIFGLKNPKSRDSFC
ncbi:hypothetical protein SAMN04488112_107157 [Melghirimyces thermohalophilus]|uniref:Uncharacterized protein n=1 Tax=Melghirimyces thermohalophilus TaxID=1236220 RepID=A0A1G6LBV6_9BACL|nr:YeeE/YedE family protein [Melghirimyces thermohalophilus]SDC40730.1 hypothetical protein SAMN04488112_107157 [Melghirimyces thermohalophilus]